MVLSYPISIALISVLIFDPRPFLNALVCGTEVRRWRLPAGYGVCLLDANAGEEVPLYSVCPCLAISGNFASSARFSYFKEIIKKKKKKKKMKARDVG